MFQILTDATRWHRRGHPRLPLVVVVCFSITVFAACSTSSGVSTLGGASDGASPTPDASADPEDALFAFAECMREHGIDMPDPVIVERRAGSGDEGGFRSSAGGDNAERPFDPNSEEFQAAEEACREHLEGLTAGPRDGPQMTEEQQQAFLDFAQCMREHGIDMPDPDFSGGGVGITIGPSEEGNGSGPAVAPRSEEFQAAEEECRKHLEGFAPEGPMTEVAP